MTEKTVKKFNGRIAVMNGFIADPETGLAMTPQAFISKYGEPNE